jgi:hypothetical protein
MSDKEVLTDHLYLIDKDKVEFWSPLIITLSAHSIIFIVAVIR